MKPFSAAQFVAVDISPPSHVYWQLTIAIGLFVPSLNLPACCTVTFVAGFSLLGMISRQRKKGKSGLAFAGTLKDSHTSN